MITENEFADLNPKFVQSQGRTFVVWDQFSENGSKINFAEFSGSQFTSSDSLIKKDLFEKDVGFYNGKPFIALIEENELFFGEADKTLKQLTKDEFVDSQPKILFYQNIALTGRGIIVWLKDDAKGKEVFFSQITDGLAFKEESTEIFVQANQFELIEDNSGNAVLLWSEITGNQPELFYSVYGRTTNNWSEKGFLTDSLALEEKFSGTFTQQNSLVISVLETEIELKEQTDGFTGKDLEEDKQLTEDTRTFSNIPVYGNKNLIFVSHAYVNDLEFTKEIEFSSIPKANQETTVKAWIKNSGDLALKNVKVRLVDESSSQPIETKTLKTVLKTGKEKLIEFNWTPKNIQQNKTVSVLLDPLDEIQESNENNNKKTIFFLQITQFQF